MKCQWKAFKDELPKEDKVIWRYIVDIDHISCEKTSDYWNESISKHHPNDLWCYADVPEKPQIRWNSPCICKEEVDLAEEEKEIIKDRQTYDPLGSIIYKICKKIGMIE